MKPVYTLILLIALVAGCSSSKPMPSVEPAGDVPMFAGLGDRGRKVTTASPEAQQYFDQGLSFLYAFNHDEALRSFRKATEIDPDCAMCWWGVAIANGPHINNPVVPEERAREAWATLQAAQAKAAAGSAIEQALIEALASRYADPPPKDRAALDLAYANAMRGVWQRYPQDADVGALFAEAMMDLRPWDLWTRDGRPQPGTEEIVSTLEAVMKVDPDHPLALHLYIHAVEASPTPGRADAAADRLRELQPGLGHLVHMPTHIDVRRGRWQEAVESNAKAIEADRAYRRVSPKQGFYGLYMAHDNHMLAYAAMMNGQRDLAVRVMDELIAEMPEQWTIDWAMIADGYMVMPLEVRMRFGLWDDVLAAAEFPERFPYARAMRHYARGVAYAAKGDTPTARAEQADFLAARAAVPATGVFGNNKMSDLLLVAEDLLEGEILYREGRQEEAFRALRQAIVHEDALRYDEPPSWIQPVRHALGALLLKAGRAREAEVVFREDLERLPDNGWGLYGLTRSLERQRKNAEAAQVRSRFKEVWARSEVELTTPCYCEPKV
jgi:tetratricopeptide (TPR) repeat protein